MPTTTIVRRVRRIRRKRGKASRLVRRFWKGQPMMRGVHKFTRTVNLALAATADFVVAGQLSKVGSTMQFTVPAASAYTSVYGTYSYTPILGYLPGYTEFTALFDEYKLDKITLKIIPFQNTFSSESQAGGAQMSGSIPILHYINDNDGYTVLNSEAGIAEIQQYPGYKRVPLDKPYSYSFIPRCRGVVQTGGGTAVATSGTRNQWLDCGTTDVVHYGTYGIIEAICPNAQLQLDFFRIEATFHMSFKGVR